MICIAELSDDDGGNSAAADNDDDKEGGVIKSYRILPFNFHNNLHL